VPRETRSFQIVGGQSRFVRSTIDIKCPYCAKIVTAYKRSLAGSGKRCPCWATHTFDGHSTAPQTKKLHEKG